MNVKKSNKHADFRQSIKQQSSSKTSLRNLKMNRISRCYQQISPLLTECDFDSDKENNADNFTYEERNHRQISLVSDSSLNSNRIQLSKSKLDITPLYSRQLNTQESYVSSQLITVRAPFDTQAQSQIQSLKQYCDFIKEQNRRYLAQILKMQVENDVLRQKIEENQCVCYHKQQDFSSVGTMTLNQEVNTETSQQHLNFTQQRNQLIWKLMQLQEENSLQLKKIVEISSEIQNKEASPQTLDTKFLLKTIETQTDEFSNNIISQLQKHKQEIISFKRILQEIEQSCTQVSSFQEKDLVYFCGWLQNNLKNRLNTIVLPLKCQIKLLNEIKKSNKKVSLGLHNKLFKDAQTTIIQLLEQTKQAQALANMNYHRFLILQRKERCWKGRSTKS